MVTVPEDKAPGEVLPTNPDDIWKSLALENILHDVGQALGIDDSRIRRIKEILFSSDERMIRRFKARAMNTLETYLEAPYGSLMSYYKSMGLGSYMAPLVKRLKDNILRCITNALRGEECDIDRILDEGKKELKQLFLKRRRAFMRIEFHDKRINEIFGRISGEIKKIIDDYNRLKSPEKKFLEICLEITESVRDPISYYNIIWALGFIFKALEFKDYERPLISVLSRIFGGIYREYIGLMDRDRCEGIRFIRNISKLLKNVFMYVAYFPELLRDSRFLDKLPIQPIDIENKLNRVLEWLENDRSYGRLREIIRQRYEKEVMDVLSGKLPLDTDKVIRILESLEESLSSAREMDIETALNLVHSLLFHQKAIQYTLSIIKSYLLEYKSTKLRKQRGELENEIKYWSPFRESPDMLPNYIEDIVGEIHASISEDEVKTLGIKNLADTLKTLPILSASVMDVQYPQALLAIGNYILINEKPGSAYEAELPIVINNKYRIRRRFWIEKDIKNRIMIRETFTMEHTKAEYVIIQHSIFRKQQYMEFIDKKLGELHGKLKNIEKDLSNIKRLVGTIDHALEHLMNFNAEEFHRLLQTEGLAGNIKMLLDKDFDSFLATKRLA